MSCFGETEGLNKVRTKLSVKEYAVTHSCKVNFFQGKKTSQIKSQNNNFSRIFILDLLSRYMVFPYMVFSLVLVISLIG